ncbi:BZ3500_MvSof-1268-A1-R1_Chr6-2g08539 [Microbotryum saponariae]|uniref:BZ3500_MvSof-1268-A1-R1_Chr6-2g08539 protein n=1 Tax=Microbotryum saponariae TaxID=289078 RepID=A0A2X0NNN4_9BASI|nr:BZ3500_MvSof-1268-A1-R1_Chr6-2g08539 [Microbotryum saponariae]SDA07816.1 BZ3501_MvSof-1269-A2-R1_Chr6-1g08253 [Microbotryum saponariae]
MTSIVHSSVRPIRRLSHLLLAGHNPLSPPLAYSQRSQQSPSNPSLSAVPLSSWLGSIGRAQDVAGGYHLTSISAGQGHTFLSYENSAGVGRVFAVGRNEAGQLGLDFASQEETRGLVEGFQGDRILSTKAACQSGYIVLEQQDETALYVCGNLSRGRLAQPNFYSPPPLEEHEEPAMSLLSKATQVTLPPKVGRIRQIETGFEHIQILSENGALYGSGCNTDGQLGLGEACLVDIYQLTPMPIPDEVLAQGGIATIRAGADTSALITKEGRLWTWGNSEYAQGLQGIKIDQIHTPKPIDDFFLTPSRRIVDYQCGGSFAIVLDDRGSVYSAGYGALGLGSSTLESTTVQRIDALEGCGITRIRAGWGWATAIRDAPEGNSALYTWGVNNSHGRLGVGMVGSAPRTRDKPTVPSRIYEPTEVDLPLRELGLDRDGVEWGIDQVECGSDALWVSLGESYTD